MQHLLIDARVNVGDTNSMIYFKGHIVKKEEKTAYSWFYDNQREKGNEIGTLQMTDHILMGMDVAGLLKSEVYFYMLTCLKFSLQGSHADAVNLD